MMMMTAAGEDNKNSGNDEEGEDGDEGKKRDANPSEDYGTKSVAKEGIKIALPKLGKNSVAGQGHAEKKSTAIKGVAEPPNLKYPGPKVTRNRPNRTTKKKYRVTVNKGRMKGDKERCQNMLQS